MAAQPGSGTKQRIVDATGRLFTQQGFHGTGLKQIASASAAPFGSIYHFFPGGKDELAAEVIRTSGAGYQLLVEAVWDTERDVVSSVRAVFRGAGDVLEASRYADACPIATVALEVASTHEQLREATAEVFESWREALTKRFTAVGVPRRRARALADQVIALLEGGFLLSRAARSIEPMRSVGAAAVALVRAEIER